MPVYTDALRVANIGEAIESCKASNPVEYGPAIVAHSHESGGLSISRLEKWNLLLRCDVQR